MILRPVGPHSPRVYWRRRIVLAVPVLALIAVTVFVACSPNGTSVRGAGGVLPSSPAASDGPTAASSPAGSAAGSAASAGASSASGASSAPGEAVCPATSLAVAAVTSAPSYAVGTEPTLLLQVTDTAATPCTQDLADGQVELRVYNGDARVWGSHDCKVEPGTNVQTLAPNQPVRLSITWTGLTSQPGCAGQRQRVPAGTYTLHALLGGQEGATAQFSLT